MSINLVEMLKSQVGSQIASQVSRQFGVNEQSAKTGIDAMLPTILGGLLRQVTSPGGAEKLDRTMQEGGYDGSLLDNLSNVFGGAQSSDVQKKGGDLLSTFFGDKVSMLAPILSKLTGIKLDSFSSILAMLAPLVLSFLAKQKKSMGLDAQGLSSMIVGQKDNIVAALPPGVSQAMGLGSFDLPGMLGGALSGGGHAGAVSPAASSPAAEPPKGIPTGVAVGVIGAVLLVVGYGVYSYIFGGMRPHGAAGNTVTAVPEGFDHAAEAARAASIGTRTEPAPTGESEPGAAEPASEPAAEPAAAPETTDNTESAASDAKAPAASDAKAEE